MWSLFGISKMITYTSTMKIKGAAATLFNSCSCCYWRRCHFCSLECSVSWYQMAPLSPGTELGLNITSQIKKSITWARAFLAMVWKACSTLIASLALVSKYGISFLDWHQVWALLVDTARLSRSILFPSTTNGKLSGSRGLACRRNNQSGWYPQSLLMTVTWMRNSSLQLSSDLKVFGAVTS